MMRHIGTPVLQHGEHVRNVMDVASEAERGSEATIVAADGA